MQQFLDFLFFLFFGQYDRFQVCDESRKSARLYLWFSSTAVKPGYIVNQAQCGVSGGKPPIHPAQQSSHRSSIRGPHISPTWSLRGARRCCCTLGLIKQIVPHFLIEKEGEKRLMTFLLEQLHLHTCCRNDDSLEGTRKFFFPFLSLSFSFICFLFPLTILCASVRYSSPPPPHPPPTSSVPTSRYLFGTRW